MTKKLPKRGLPPMHPGELLREKILPALDRPKAEIAERLGVSGMTLYDILKEKQPVTPVMALRLGKLCGNDHDLWLNLQKRDDLHRAKQEFGETIKAIPTLAGELSVLRSKPQVVADQRLAEIMGQLEKLFPDRAKTSGSPRLVGV
jgi:antitoxin HigA-1